MESASGSRDIVRRIGQVGTDEHADEQRRSWRAEHLSVPGTGHIHFEALPSDDTVADQLARRVAADPTDARLHVARVNHHVLHDEADRLYAALVDLFFAFGPSGAGLRTRLLNGARRLIGPQRAAALDQHLTTGFDVRSNVPPCTGSVLGTGITGETEIIRRTTRLTA